MNNDDLSPFSSNISRFDTGSSKSFSKTDNYKCVQDCSVDTIRCIIDYKYGIKVNIPGLNGLFSKQFLFDLDFIENLKKRNFNYYVKLYHQLKTVIDSMAGDYYDYIQQTGGGGTGSRYSKNDNGGDDSKDNSDNSNDKEGDGNSNSDNHNNDNENGDNKDNSDNNDDEDNDDDKKNEDEKKQTKTNQDDYKASPLSEIMSLRGICNCSGHCGNPIMKFSLLVYKSVVDRILDLNYFNKNAMISNETKFWDQLFNNLIFNNDNKLHVSKMYENLKHGDKLEWFKDVACLIYQMVGTLNLHSKRKWIDDSKWRMDDNNNNWQFNLKQIIDDVIKDKDDRKARVLNLVQIMFSSFETLYLECKHNNQIKNETLTYFILNRLMKAIMIHNYYDPNDAKQIVIATELCLYEKKSNQNDQQLLSDEKTSEIVENGLKEQFKNQIWRKIDRKLLSVICDNLDDLENLTLMRLLIITINFIVESEATLKTNIQCMHYNNRAKEEEQLINEMKINKMYDEYKKFQQSGKYDTLYDKNRNQAMAENMLTKMEIACIFLLTRTPISNQVKSAHRRGETCLYRCFSQQVINALTKLKYFDKQLQSNFNQLEYIYSGISLVTFDVSQQNETTIQKFIQNYCQKKNEIISTNKINYCLVFDTLTSTSEDAGIAKQFSEMSLGSDGVVLKIDFPKIWDNEDILCGDIEWISNYPHEHEILVAPCMIWIYEMDKDKYPEIKNARKNTKVFGAELRRMGNVSLLIKQLKEKMFKEQQMEMKHDINTNDDISGDVNVKIDVNQLSVDERKVYDCIHKILPNECDQYFDYLKKQDCLQKTVLKGLNHSLLKEMGITIIGHRIRLLDEFENL